MSAVLSFLRARHDLCADPVAGGFRRRRRARAAGHGDAALGLQHAPVRRAARDHGRRTDAGHADRRHRPFGGERGDGRGLSARDQRLLGAAPAIGLALLLGVVVGIINGIGVALLRVQPLVMTLGTGLMTGGVMIVYSQHMMASQPHVPDIIQTLGAGKVLGLVPIDLFLWLVIAALILFGLQRTGFGRLLYAVGDNREACHLAGVRVWRVLFANYVLCAILAAIAGLVLVGGTNAADLSLADSYLLPSVACVVIGGTSIFGGRGGYAGTIVGALILTVLTGLLTLLDVSEPIKQILYGAIILSLAAAYARLTE